MENIYFKMKHSGILGIIAGVCAIDHRITGSDFRNRIIKKQI